MAHPQLRVFYGSPQRSDETPPPESGAQPGKVSVRLREVLPVLLDAVRNNRSWVHDFDSEEILLPADLYEVILAYQHYRRAG